jgi:phosphate transport system ATP-binding protein
MSSRIDIIGLSAGYSGRTAIEDVNLVIDAKRVTALIGPSGCGKSTLLRCINAMHMTAAGATVSGRVEHDGVDIYSSNADPVDVRRHIGMVFQRPNPFPTMSIADNVAAGLRLGRGQRRKNHTEAIEKALRRAGLWDEVKDRLNKPGAGLSGGQQQRLCIARALAVEPDVLLMDEPCSALDPISTLTIEDTIAELKDKYTIVIVTHNLQQAARVSDTTAFLTLSGPGQPGHLIEFGPTSELFNAPKEQATEDYITGKVG